MKKILFFIPNSGWDGMRRWVITPHGILILSAILKENYQLSVIDANANDLDENQCIEQLKDINPDAVLVSALSFEYAIQSHKAVAISKSTLSDVTTVVGGVHASIMPEQVIKDTNIDYIFMGHAEERLPGFMEAIFKNDTSTLEQMNGIAFIGRDGQTILNPVKSFTADVTKLTQPDYSILDIEPYIAPKGAIGSHHLTGKQKTATIITSYGCPNKCVFCANPHLNGHRVAFRSVDDVLAEIEYLVKNHNVEQFVFIDDCFLLKRSRVLTLFNTFLDREYNFSWKTSAIPAWRIDEELLTLMKKSGCTQITISVESGVSRVIDDIIHKPLKLKIIPEIVKLCRKLKIDIGANFVIGFPGETWEEIRQTFRYAEDCNFDVIHFHIATPYPKTELYKIAKENNLLPGDFNFETIKFIGHSKGYITTNEFTPEELMILRAYEWDRINFKTEEKTKKIARMYNMSVEALKEHRKATRLNIGVIN